MLNAKPLPPQQYLNECFIFCADGTLVWKERPLHHFQSLQSYEKFLVTFTGKIAGTVDTKYVKINLTYCGKKIKLYAHRVIWTMHNGAIPKDKEVDHQDTNTLNNKISNLRLATSTNNSENRSIASNNTSGIKGVSLDKGKWLAKIGVNGKRIRIGHFNNINDASAAIAIARTNAHEQFANHGI
jgi:hypothetical protein